MKWRMRRCAAAIPLCWPATYRGHERGHPAVGILLAHAPEEFLEIGRADLPDAVRAFGGILSLPGGDARDQSPAPHCASGAIADALRAGRSSLRGKRIAPALDRGGR